ncbi:hypothetical protein JR316_0006942 [Psilocybe cubensis]|uniref:Uncharacterized protein n=2 Tax=Psilocybe cubensis TaxID=181762 RepID=A0A8H8CMC6_PSICU|nr:hypothetical protein JR316_0006942 [Psilocybe cubensis]KAH9480344.1 hypothetical protein JR316_0006942 [Psilocybe cubensis]
MPTTRRQAAIQEGRIKPTENDKGRKKQAVPTRKSRKQVSPQSADDTPQRQGNSAPTPNKRNVDDAQDHAAKKPKLESNSTKQQIDGQKHEYQSGTIERGHIYFFYRPRVQVNEARTIDDIRNFHILLIPRPPQFAQGQKSSSGDEGAMKQDPSDMGKTEMNVLAPGADAVPAPDEAHSSKKNYRLITVGKKRLPNPEAKKETGKLTKETFWGTVTSVGNDLDSLVKGLGQKSYETKTRGTRHEGPARLVARGGYAIVNSEGETPSKRETHLGYHVSHPGAVEMGDVQKSLGIFSASSFIIQVKNPLAPAANTQQAHSKPVEYPDWIMQGVFGAGKGCEAQSRGREHYGLRFASCETPKLLDYKGAELLLIAARDGEEGLETSLGDGRGAALTEMEEKEARESLGSVFDELGLNLDEFPVESLRGSWI